MTSDYESKPAGVKTQIIPVAFDGVERGSLITFRLFRVFRGRFNCKARYGFVPHPHSHRDPPQRHLPAVSALQALLKEPSGPCSNLEADRHRRRMITAALDKIDLVHPLPNP